MVEMLFQFFQLVVNQTLRFQATVGRSLGGDLQVSGYVALPVSNRFFEKPDVFVSAFYTVKGSIRSIGQGGKPLS